MSQFASYGERPATFVNPPPQQPGVATTYPQPVQYASPTVVTQTTTTSDASGFRKAIPALPMALAVLCLILNIVFPGIGTIVAGFCVLCVGNVGESGASRFGTFCINFWVGWLQLLLVFCFFIGWVWSIIWGIAFVTLAADAQNTKTTTTSFAVPQPLPQAVPTYTTAPQVIPV